MFTSRKRRFVKRAVMAVVVVVLLPVWYVGSMAAISWRLGREHYAGASPIVATSGLAVDYGTPMAWYMRSELLGHRELRMLMRVSHRFGGGQRVTWPDIEEAYDAPRQQR